MKNQNIDSNDLTVNPSDTETWPDFVRIVEKHNGVWEGY